MSIKRKKKACSQKRCLICYYKNDCGIVLSGKRLSNYKQFKGRIK